MASPGAGLVHTGDPYDFEPFGAARVLLDCELAAEARQHGWDREIDRHQRIADRVRALLTELGESCEPLEDTP